MRAAKQEFLEQSAITLSQMVDMLDHLPTLSLATLPPQNTVVVVVDMINGFAREGALQSVRVEGLIPGIVRLLDACGKLHIETLAFADHHSERSPEFGAYPQHCMAGTSESEVVAEIQAVGRYQLFPKNSTNGFQEPAFQEWLHNNPQKENFIVVGDCTDICIQQFAVSLKTWFNRQDRAVRVIVPETMVDTYDAGLHMADLMHVTALFSMMGNGVEVVREVGG